MTLELQHPTAIGGALGDGPVIPVVDDAGALTIRGVAHLFATMLYPAEPEARDVFVARGLMATYSAIGAPTPADVAAVLLRPRALGGVDATWESRWLTGLMAGLTLRLVWWLAVTQPASASLNTAWAMLAGQKPARSFSTWRNAWVGRKGQPGMAPVAHLWAAVESRCRGKTTGPILNSFPSVGYTGRIDLMRLIEESEIYRAFLEGRFQPIGYRPRQSLVNPARVWRVPESWRPAPQREDWPPTGRAVFDDMGAFSEA